MATEPQLQPVSDSVAKIGGSSDGSGSIAVGEDLGFQQAWWKFERAVWIFFALILVADVSGLLGRGPLSKAEAYSSSRSLHVKYERVERANTPSIMSILPAQGATRDGKLRLYVSDSIVKQLGAQRVVPQPESSALGDGGVTYTFPASTGPITVQIQLQSSFVGLHAFRIGIPGDGMIDRKVLVLP